MSRFGKMQRKRLFDDLCELGRSALRQVACSSVYAKSSIPISAHVKSQERDRSAWCVPYPIEME